MAVPFNNHVEVEAGSYCAPPDPDEGGVIEMPGLMDGKNPRITQRVNLHMTTVHLLRELGDGDLTRGVEALASAHLARRRWSGGH